MVNWQGNLSVEIKLHTKMAKAQYNFDDSKSTKVQRVLEVFYVFNDPRILQ